MLPRPTSPSCALAGRIAGYRSSRCSRCSLAGRSFNSSRATRAAALLDHLRKVADFAAAVGAQALVFGSPKNRVRGERPVDEAMHIARDAFRVLAPHARDRGVVFCIEANPPEYGCDFITQTSEAVELCRLADDSSIRVNADLGGMILAGEDPAGAIAQAAAFVGTRSRQRAASRATVDDRRARACRVGARSGGILGMDLNRDARSGLRRSVGGAGARD